MGLVGVVEGQHINVSVPVSVATAIFKDTEYKIRNLKIKLSSRRKQQANEKNIGF